MKKALSRSRWQKVNNHSFNNNDRLDFYFHLMVERLKPAAEENWNGDDDANTIKQGLEPLQHLVI